MKIRTILQKLSEHEFIKCLRKNTKNLLFHSNDFAIYYQKLLNLLDGQLMHV